MKYIENGTLDPEPAAPCEEIKAHEAKPVFCGACGAKI